MICSSLQVAVGKEQPPEMLAAEVDEMLAAEVDDENGNPAIRHIQIRGGRLRPEKIMQSILFYTFNYPEEAEQPEAVINTAPKARVHSGEPLADYPVMSFIFVC